MSTWIQINKLSSFITENELRNEFSDVGSIRKVQIQHWTKPIGYIQFHQTIHAKNAAQS